MLYQEHVPIAKQVGTRPKYLNKLSLHTELSQHPQSASKTTEVLFVLTEVKFFCVLINTLDSFSVWAKKALHCWKSVFSAFSLYLTPAVKKKKRKKSTEYKYLGNQARWLQDFFVRGILITYLNPSAKRRVHEWHLEVIPQDYWGDCLPRFRYLP